jgi:hypothetical protein
LVNSVGAVRPRTEGFLAMDDGDDRCRPTL